MGDPAIFEGRIVLILCYHITYIDSILPPCLSLKQCVSSRSVDQRNIIGGWFHAITNLLNLITDKKMFSAQLEALKMPASICSPGGDGGAVKFWISGGGGTGSLSKSPSSGTSYRTTVNLLAQWKVYPGTIRGREKNGFI